MKSEGSEKLIEIRFPSRPDVLRLVRATVAELAVANGCTDRCVRDIVIAVDEACQNVIRHAYGGAPTGEIVLDVRRDQNHIFFDLIDHAAPVDKSKVKPRALNDIRPGGLGTHFIKECMDEAGFQTPPGGAGNLLRMVKRIS